MASLIRRVGPALLVLALGLAGGWGCAEHGNEKDFAPTPGSAPPGAPANSEEAAPASPAPKAP